MKYIVQLLFLIIIVLNFMGCSKNNSSKVINPSIAGILTPTTLIKEPTPTTDLIPTPTTELIITPTDHPKEDLPIETNKSELEEYQLCGLTINDTQAKILMASVMYVLPTIMENT